MLGLLAIGTAMGWLTREWMFALLLVVRNRARVRDAGRCRR